MTNTPSPAAVLALDLIDATRRHGPDRSARLFAEALADSDEPRDFAAGVATAAIVVAANFADRLADVVAIDKAVTLAQLDFDADDDGPDAA